MRSARIMSLVGALSTLGCAKPPAQPQPAPPPLTAERPHRAPLVVTVDGPKAPVVGVPFDIKVVIDRLGGARGPVTLGVILPAGVDLVQGMLIEEVGGSDARIERTLTVRANEIPTDDVKVTASSGGQGWGARATGAYRFGRPEPKLAQPRRSGTPLVVRGHNFGQGIPLGASRDGGPGPR